MIAQPVRTAGSWHSIGQRIYEEKALDRLRFIKEARQLSFSIGEIKQVLEHYENGPPCGCGARPLLKTLTKQKLEEIDSGIDEMKALKAEMLKLYERTLALEGKTQADLLKQVEPKIGDALFGRLDPKKATSMLEAPVTSAPTLGVRRCHQRRAWSITSASR